MDCQCYLTTCLCITPAGSLVNWPVSCICILLYMCYVNIYIYVYICIYIYICTIYNIQQINTI